MSASRQVHANSVSYTFSLFFLFLLSCSAAGCTPYAASLIADYFDPVGTLCLWSEFVFSNVDTLHVQCSWVVISVFSDVLLCLSPFYLYVTRIHF